MSPYIVSDHGVADAEEMNHLWSLAIDGDLEARKRFLGHAKNWFRAWAVSRMPRDLVDDFVSSAWPEVYFKLRNFDPARGRIWTWLTYIARDVARKVAIKAEPVDYSRDGYKSRPRHCDLENPRISSINTICESNLPEARLLDEGSFAVPSKALEETDALDTVITILSSLTEKQRYLVVHYYGIGVERKTSTQLAAEVGKTRQCVEWTIKNAVTKLRTNATRLALELA